MPDYERPVVTKDEEEKLLQVYEALKSLSRAKVPCVSCNSRMALGFIWQVINDLGLKYEHVGPELLS